MSKYAHNKAQDKYYDYREACDQAFRPFAPIEIPSLFAGRLSHIERLVSEIGAPGRHVAIFGERGVGKTSLARLACYFLERDEERTHLVSCQKASTFDTVFARVLMHAGAGLALNGVDTERGARGIAGIPPFTLAGKHAKTERFKSIVDDTRRMDPAYLLTVFGDTDGLIILDEFDQVADEPTYTRVAELIKHFSDAQSKTKIILVGVVDTLSQLIGEHASLTRSLAQIKLDRMSDDELQNIITKGAEHLNTPFKDTIRHRIVRLADGFPYFVHLLARHACRVAGRVFLRNPNARPIVAEEEYTNGLTEALENSEHSLQEQYQRAVITTRRKSDKFELVLWGMALSSDREVQVQSLAKHVGFFCEGDVPKASGFSSTLAKLVSDERGAVLTKIRDVYYKFTDPLMRPYVRWILELKNLLMPGQQLSFPFM